VYYLAESKADQAVGEEKSPPPEPPPNHSADLGEESFKLGGYWVSMQGVVHLLPSMVLDGGRAGWG